MQDIFTATYCRSQVRVEIEALQGRKAEAMRAAPRAGGHLSSCAHRAGAHAHAAMLEDRSLLEKYRFKFREFAEHRCGCAGEGGDRGAAGAQGGGDARRNAGAAPRAGGHLCSRAHGTPAHAARAYCRHSALRRGHLRTSEILHATIGGPMRCLSAMLSMLIGCTCNTKVNTRLKVQYLGYG